jgi:hypothetical protein
VSGAAAEPGPVSRMQEAGVRNFANLQALVAEAGRSVRRDDRAPSDEVAVALDAAVIGWATLGLSVWLAGNHLPTQDLAAPGYVELGRAHLRDVVVAMLRG